MNFAYGVIAIVGVLAAIILGLIVESPDDIIEPRMISVEEKPTVCTMQWDPMCGVDGETYGNLCVLDAADVKFDYEGECVIAQPELEPTVDVELEEIVDASETTAIESESEVETLPMSLTVSIPEGAGGPGCEKTNECYSPYEVTVTVGTTVTWSNDDFLAHTEISQNMMDSLILVYSCLATLLNSHLMM